MQDVKQDRWKYIGGSDIPIIMGLVDYGKNRWHLLREKAQLWEDTFEGNEYTEYGNKMEDVIRAYVNYSYNAEFVEDKKILEPCYRYHADGYDSDRNEVLEIKTTSDELGDEPPKKFLVQLLYGMTLFEADKGLLAVYTRPKDFSEDFEPSRLKFYCIDLSGDYLLLLAEVADAFDEFLYDLTYLKEHPDCKESDLPSRSALVPIANQLVKLENSIALLKQMEADYKELKANMKTAMEKRGIKSWSFNNTKFTLVPDADDEFVETFDETSFARDHADLYELYKTFKVKKGKAGYVRVTQKKGKVENE